MSSELLHELILPSQSKIVMLILDGLGGLALQPGGKTELETACTPNLDALAAESALGLTMPAGPGITVGSGPGHLALFGYDPIECEIGRGALEALGVDFDLEPQDVAARGNFCTLDERGLILDRRAGRIPTEDACALVQLLRTIRMDGVEFFIEPIKEHRFAFILRGSNLGDGVSDTDPQKTGVEPLQACAADPDSGRTAGYVNRFIAQARTLLRDRHPANMIMLRGFTHPPTLPSYSERYGLHAAAIAVNGMYRGVARMAGMAVLKVNGGQIADEIDALEKYWADYDFFYMHVKGTDTCGEAGDFAGKVHVIEQVDALLPRIRALGPEVLIIGGDHSSPAVLQSHSWHPVPLLLYAKHVRADGLAEFGEHACARGSLGTLPAQSILPIALANAGRLAKYGA